MAKSLSVTTTSFTIATVVGTVLTIAEALVLLVALGIVATIPFIGLLNIGPRVLLVILEELVSRGSMVINVNITSRLLGETLNYILEFINILDYIPYLILNNISDRLLVINL